MSVITDVVEPNIWEEVCKDFRRERQPYDDDNESVVTEQENYDPAKVTPVFYGKMYAKIETDDAVLMDEFDPAASHPACVGYAFLDKPPKSPPPEACPPDKIKSIPREFLEYYIFPVLLPAMEEMLKQAKLEKCFERKRTKFSALDFLTEYLYRNNPNHTDRSETSLLDIPFVEEWLKDHPRPPLPLSLLWTEEEGALIIQSFWRGYKIRCNPEIQELRQWQKDWRMENEDIKAKVNEFWAEKIPSDLNETDTSQGKDSPSETRSRKNTPTTTSHNMSNNAELEDNEQSEQIDNSDKPNEPLL